jgi:ATP-dependent 26S proteasome regulatory subunit
MSPAESNWFAQILAHLSIQQAETFVIHGDIAGYPEVPGEGLIEYLRRMTLAPARDRAMKSSGDQWDSLGKRPGMSPAQAELAASEFQADLVAASQIIVALSPSRGLIADRADLVAFEKLSPPPDNPFAVQDLAACFRRVDRYFQASAVTEGAPSLCAILHDADLVFDGGGPLVEPERTLISYIHHWSASPLLAHSGMPHRIYLVSPSAVGMRPAILQGRVSQVKVPLPTTETRTDFIAQVLDLANRSGAVKLAEGMDARALARITGALNLTQIEDVIYQAAAADGVVTNDLAQARKDELVAATYGGVLEIEYPTDGFETIFGCELLKGYFRDYAYPLLSVGSTSTPKGALLVGPPGCLDADTPIYDPVDQSTKTVKDRWMAESPFHVYSLDKHSRRVVISPADPPWQYKPAELFKVTTKLGRSLTVTGGHRLWTGRGYQMICDAAEQLRAYGPIPLPSIEAPSPFEYSGGARHSTQTAPGFPDDRQHDLHFDDGQPQPCPPCEGWLVDHIVNIESVGVNNYYDFHVPGHENYWACGFIHHNTGKTCFAKALAAEVGLPLVIIRMDRLKNKFVGESNKNVARLCEGILALAPCVVLADELDKIMPESDDSTGVSQEILGQLQTFLSDVPRGTAFFLATTNYPARVPRALLRPGRFESTIPVLPQHLDGYRGQLLKALGSRSEYRVADGIDYEAIVKSAGDYAGADLEKLVLEADFERQQCGAEAITQEHFMAALGYVVPTVRMAGEMVEQALAYTSSPRFVPESLRPQVGRSATATEDGAAPAPRRQIRKIA